MDFSWEKLIYSGAWGENILHMTSHCPQNCVFCSHKNNPEGVEVFTPGHIPLKVLESLIELINPEKPVRTGESVSRIIEGEPMAHPYFYSVIENLKKRYPQCLIEIVTGGAFLDREGIKRLSKLKPLRIKLSLNIIDPKLRKKYLGLRAANDVENIMKNLNDFQIPWSATLVAIPHLTGWVAFRESILQTSLFYPRDITVYRYAYTRITSEKIRLGRQTEKKLEEEIKILREQISVPLLLEPPGFGNLEAQIEGVRKGSPADKAGLQTDDIVLRVGETPCSSRVDAYELLQSGEGKFPVKIKRGGEIKDLYLDKEKNQPGGAIFYQDISRETLEKIKNLSRNIRLGVITSELAFPFLKTAWRREKNVCVLPVENRKFGGSIGAVGLLGIEDVLRQCREKVKDAGINEVILPSIMFDQWGRDLWGFNICQLEEEIGVKCRELSF